MPRFSAHLTQLFTELPFAERFGAAAQAGFEGCEFRSPYECPARDVAAWLGESGLECVLFNLPGGNWAAGERGIAALPGRRAEFRETVALALDYARVLGARRLHVMAGIVPPGTGRHECREAFIENLIFAADAAARDGRTMLIEPLNTRDTPGYFLTTQAQAFDVLQAVGAANLRMQFDCYHAQIMEGDLATKLRTYLPAIGHVQIAGVPGRHEPDDGEVNFGYLLPLLDALGYDGWVGCEYVPRDGTLNGLGWMRRLAPATARNAVPIRPTLSD